MNRRSLLTLSAAAGLSACAPVVQRPFLAQAGFAGPRFADDDRFISFDGAPLGLSRWLPTGGEPWAVIVALHGMNDYANAFHLAGPWWAERGIATYAYDQRGHGRSPQRGVWGGEDLMLEDARTAVALARQAHPGALVALAGESMGGAVAVCAMASDRPPAADRLVLLAPAVWGWRSQPLPNRLLLWVTAHTMGSTVFEPPDWLASKIVVSDNRDELIRMGRDKLMIWGARSDTLYGLVNLMQDAWDKVGRSPAPTAYLYGQRDQMIPKEAAFPAAARLKPTDRSAFYPEGYHLLVVDKQRERVLADVEGFLRDPKALLVSGMARIPSAPTPSNAVAA